MELTRLSQLTGDQVYFNAALRIQEKLATLRGEYGTLVSVFLSPNGGHSGDYTVGGMVDRYACPAIHARPLQCRLNYLQLLRVLDKDGATPRRSSERLGYDVHQGRRSK